MHGVECHAVGGTSTRYWGRTHVAGGSRPSRGGPDAAAASVRARDEEIPKAGPYAPGWDVPARFNFTRDVIEAIATDPLKPAMTFVDREGIVDRRTFHEIAGDAARWAHLMRTRLDRGDRSCSRSGTSRRGRPRCSARSRAAWSRFRARRSSAHGISRSASATRARGSSWPTGRSSSRSRRCATRSAPRYRCSSWTRRSTSCAGTCRSRRPRTRPPGRPP